MSWNQRVPFGNYDPDEHVSVVWTSARFVAGKSYFEVGGICLPHQHAELIMLGAVGETTQTRLHRWLLDWSQEARPYILIFARRDDHGLRMKSLAIQFLHGPRGEESLEQFLWDFRL